MQKRRRRKIWLFTGLIIVALLVVGYIYRYPLLLKFEYARLQSLDCGKNTGTTNVDCLQKIWVHRVNSLERYDLLKNKFDGFEADLTYRPDSGSFFIYHPPRVWKDHLITLSEYLEHVDLHHKRIWFDTRFVGISNIQETLLALSKLDDTLLVKKSCIFELYDARAAAIFTQHGYTSSFNASEQIQQRAEKDGLFRDSINRDLSQVAYVSQDAQYLPVIKKIFPGKRIVTWDLHFSRFFNRSRLQELLNDPRVDILLVNIKTAFYR